METRGGKPRQQEGRVQALSQKQYCTQQRIAEGGILRSGSGSGSGIGSGSGSRGESQLLTLST